MKILIVDDSKLNRVFAADYIVNAEIDIEIIYATNGLEALAQVEAHEVDIVLLDIIMPELDGMETLKRLMADDNNKHIKVIMYTALQEMSKLKTCFEIGAVDFIRKPIEEVEFISRLKSVIRQHDNEIDLHKYIKEIEAQKEIIMQTNMQLIQVEKMAGIGHLAAGVAHEINNPIGFVTSNFEVLKDYIYHFIAFYDLIKQASNKDEVLNKIIVDFNEKFNMQEIFDDLVELYEETQGGLSRVTKIVQSLRNFARSDSLDDLEFYNINDGIKDTLVIANNYLKYNTELELSLNEVPDIKVMGQQINQVILNLITNAVDAIVEKNIKEDNHIKITSSSNKDFVIMTITDSGMGISDANIKSLFNPFFTTKAVGQGVGLGLSMSYDIIVNKHGGEISVESEENEYTTFTMKLPINQ